MPRAAAPLALLTLAALALRVVCLGSTFVSSDDVELAHRVLTRDGWLWMVEEPYGLCISALVKAHAVAVVALGWPLSEAVWRLPVAVAGALLVPVAFAALRGMGCSGRAAWCAAGVAAVLPIHVFHSRYLWGYEVLGALCLLPAVASLVRFFAVPTAGRGIAAGVLSAVYLLSHGYIVPFFAVLLLLALLFGDLGEPRPARRLRTGLKRLAARGVLVPVLLAAPVYQFAIRHALEKRTAPGFYLGRYTVELVQNVGLPLALAAVVSLGVFLVRLLRRGRGWPADPRDLVVLALLGAGLLYLAPILLLTPPGITLTRNYLFLGPLCLLLASIAAADRHGFLARPAAVPVAVATVLLTGYGAFESYATKDRWFDPTLVACERGVLHDDPGTKAVGYLVRRTLPDDATVLFLHRAMEPPNVAYYAGRDAIAFYDHSLRRTMADLALHAPRADYVVADLQQRGFVEEHRDLTLLLALSDNGRVQALVYGKPGRTLRLAGMPVTLAGLNACFDRECAPRIGAGLVGRDAAGAAVVPAK